MDEIRFDDIEALEARIGDEYGPWGPEVEISQERVNQFAELTGDHQWIHVDVERAKTQSPFGGPIVHGFFTLAMLPWFMSQAMVCVSPICQVGLVVGAVTASSPLTLKAELSIETVLSAAS